MQSTGPFILPPVHSITTTTSPNLAAIKAPLISPALLDIKTDPRYPVSYAPNTMPYGLVHNPPHRSQLFFPFDFRQAQTSPLPTNSSSSSNSNTTTTTTTTTTTIITTNELPMTASESTSPVDAESKEEIIRLVEWMRRAFAVAYDTQTSPAVKKAKIEALTSSKPANMELFEMHSVRVAEAKKQMKMGDKRPYLSFTPRMFTVKDFSALQRFSIAPVGNETNRNFLCYNMPWLRYGPSPTEQLESTKTKFADGKSTRCNRSTSPSSRDSSNSFPSNVYTDGHCLVKSLHPKHSDHHLHLFSLPIRASTETVLDHFVIIRLRDDHNNTVLKSILKLRFQGEYTTPTPVDPSSIDDNKINSIEQDLSEDGHRRLGKSLQGKADKRPRTFRRPLKTKIGHSPSSQNGTRYKHQAEPGSHQRNSRRSNRSTSKSSSEGTSTSKDSNSPGSISSTPESKDNAKGDDQSLNEDRDMSQSPSLSPERSSSVESEVGRLKRRRDDDTDSSSGNFDPRNMDTDSTDSGEMDVDHVSNTTGIDVLELKGKDAERAGRLLRRHVALKRLYGRGLKMTSSDIVDFSHALGEDTMLEYLNLSDCRLGNTGASSIATALRANTKLEHLHLERNGIRSKGIRHLSSAMSSHGSTSTLLTLNLTGNVVGKLSGAPLAAIAQGAHALQFLFLNDMNLDDDICNKIATGLKASKSLRRLDLNGNAIGASGILGLMQAIIAPHPLRVLNIADVGASHFSNGLSLTCLEEVDLSNNRMMDKGIKLIAAQLKESHYLIRLNLFDNRIDSSTVYELCEAILVNTKIQWLQVDDCPNLRNLCQGSKEEAISNLVRLYSERLMQTQQRVGEQHLLTARCRGHLGHILSKTNQLEEALNHLQKSLTDTIALLGSMHVEVAACHERLAMVLCQVNNPKSALTQLEHLFAIQRNTFGEDHPDTKRVSVLMNHVQSTV